LPDADLLLDRLALLIQASAVRPVVLIDGGSGAGKTTLATALASHLPAQLVSLDDIYPGWDGLESASAAVADEVLAHSRWQRWDWVAGRPADVHGVDPAAPLIVEGSGALSRRNRDLATFGLWLELPTEERRRRALERDGETYAPHWERWARQERAFFRRERPDLLAVLVLDGADLTPAR